MPAGSGFRFYDSAARRVLVIATWPELIAMAAEADPNSPIRFSVGRGQA